MDSTRIRLIAAGTGWLFSTLFCCTAQADDTIASTTVAATHNLPGLLDSTPTAPAHFGLDGQKVELSYDGHQRIWDARLDEFLAPGASVTLDYGTLLNDRFGAGAALHRENDHADMWVNGVYALAPHLRLHVAGGQLRAAGDAGTSSGNADSVLQNSYLVGAKHYWNDSLLSDVGITSYAVETGTGSNSASDLDAAPIGRQQGNVLDLNLQPLPGSRIELRRETRRLSYDAGDNQSRQYLTSNRVHFSQYLDDCINLQGGYSTNEETSQLDLKLARNKWYVNMSRTQGGSDGNDTSIGVGYTLPLGRAPIDNGKCASQTPDSGGFTPLIHSTVKRPEQFPTEPLTADNTID